MYLVAVARALRCPHRYVDKGVDSEGFTHDAVWTGLWKTLWRSLLAHVAAMRPRQFDTPVNTPGR